LLGQGDFWVVKSEKVEIQGRYGATQWTLNGLAATRALAFGGAFLQGHRLVVEPQEGDIMWDGKHVLDDFPSEFHVPDLVAAHYHEGDDVVDLANRNLPLRIVTLELPEGVRVVINRWQKHLDARITMRPQSEQDGHCGNFDGDASNDRLEQIQARMALEVPSEESLFEGEIFTHLGCFADRQGAFRDLPVYIGKGIDIDQCAAACKEWTYFGRQWHGECWCGNSFGRYEQLDDDACSCSSRSNIGDARNCIYAYGGGGGTEVKSLSDCPEETRAGARTLCGAAAGNEGQNLTGDLLDACIFDVCFGGATFAVEDAKSEKLG
jgi:hypothetical protein